MVVFLTDFPPQLKKPAFPVFGLRVSSHSFRVAVGVDEKSSVSRSVTRA